MAVREYEYEPINGLPENLPEGESIVWQGAPRWTALANRVFQVRTLALYFAALIGIHV
ncbi:MAG: PH domain-containing protein, partial [Halieaceae bacterium]|nr:PH domain-containing protein [Halieaceae bacterium]